MSADERQAAADELLLNIKNALPELKKLLSDVTGEWGEEDKVYRFYHHSFKVYRLQASTTSIRKWLLKLAPNYRSKYRHTTLCGEFEEIYFIGTGNEFTLDHNHAWSLRTRSILEAFWHAKYFLEQAVRYGETLDEAPQLLPNGWASLLHLYGIR